jgi:hypothetical protein
VNIVKEYVFLLVVNYCCEFIHHILQMMPVDGLTKLPRFSCLVFGLRTDFSLDVIKSISFFFILNYFSNMTSSRRRASTPYVHQLDDFCVIPRNRHYFRRYLNKKFPDLVPVLNESLVEMLDFRVSVKSSVFPPELQSAFDKFRTTVSFATLKLLNDQAETIMARGYEY